MTKKEKDLKVLEAFGLKIGDRVKINSDSPTRIFRGDIFVIVERTDGAIVLQQVSIERTDDGIVFHQKVLNGSKVAFNVNFLLDESWTQLEPLVKDRKCKDIECDKCPLHKEHLNCGNYAFSGAFSGSSNKTIGKIYEMIRDDLYEAKKELFDEEEFLVKKN